MTDVDKDVLTMADILAVASQPELPALQHRLNAEFKLGVTTQRLTQALNRMYRFNLLDSTKPLSEMGDYARRTLAAMCTM